MGSARQVLRSRFAAPVLLVLFAAGQAGSHEGLPQRPPAKGPIDPKQSFPSLVVSGAGGHFHTLLLSAGARSLFAGTHLGLFRSDDRGLTWRLATSRFSGEEVHGLARDARKGVLYAATHGQGLLRSRDGGRQWQSHNHGLPARDLHALALDPHHPQRLYVWVVGHGLFRSEDGGERWDRMAGASALPAVESLAVNPEEPDRLYAGTTKGVWIGDSQGREWQFPRGGLPHQTAGVAIPSWAPGLVLAATLEGAFVGRTDGTGWERLPALPSWWGVITSFAFLADRPDIIFVVTHEGVVAARRSTGGDWIPLVDLMNAQGKLK